MSVIDRKACASLDLQDPLAPLQSAFLPPGAGRIHLDGGSIGAVPAALPARMSRFLLEEWSALRSHGWVEADWVHLPRKLGDKLAPLLGASPGEVVCCDSTSVNLFKLLLSALGLRAERKVIVSERGNFPSDLYIAQGAIRLLGRGHELRLVDRDEDLFSAVDEKTAVLMLTQVDYRSGRRHDMESITRLAHDRGALMLWDLSHSAGAIPVDLNGAGADFALGCGYKYLNGGPGAPAFLWVRRDLQARIDPPITGWMGHAARSRFETLYEPAPGVERNLVGAPVVLGLIALDAALDIWSRVDLPEFFRKSRGLSQMLIELVGRQCPRGSLTLASPEDPEHRGGHVAFRHKRARDLIKALDARGIVGGFRLPDILRFGMAPLSLRYVDIWDTAEALSDLLGPAHGEVPEPLPTQRSHTNRAETNRGA